VAESLPPTFMVVVADGVLLGVGLAVKELR
jgi:hypothetical protein